MRDFTVPTLHSKTSATSSYDKSFEIAQNHRAAKDIGNLLQRALHRSLNLVRRKLIERRLRQIFDFDRRVTLFRLRVDRNIFLQVPLEPALVIQRFANGDAIQPGLERTAHAENCESHEML